MASGGGRNGASLLNRMASDRCVMLECRGQGKTIARTAKVAVRAIIYR